MSETPIISVKARSHTFSVIHLGDRKGTQDPWTMAFVYAPNGNVVVTGGSSNVRKYIKTRFPYCIYNMTFWSSHQTRDIRWTNTRLRKYREHWCSCGISICHRSTPRTSAAFREYQQGINILFAGAPISTRFRISKLLLVKTHKSKCFFYRRLPHKWLTEWDQFIH
jgi:hypothetical protein